MNLNMGRKSFCLAAFLILITLAIAVPAEENVSNESASAGENISNESVLVEENVSGEMPLNFTNETISEGIICDETRCDEGCVVCSDSKCHGQDFACSEDISIEKILPESADIGVAQVNILIRNTGNVDLKNISAEISGDGILTLEKIAIEALVSGDKDYTFTKIRASKAGVIDLVVKLYVNNELKDTIVRQLNVLEEKVNVTIAAPEFNITELTNELDKLKEQYAKLEQDYQNKKLEGYPVDIVYDKLKETSNYINDAQSYLVEEDYKKVKVDLRIINDNLDILVDELKNAKKQEKTLTDKIKANMIYIGSIAAAIVSILTAFSLVRSHVNKQKLVELHNKLRFKEKKEEEKQEEKGSQP